MFIPVHKVYIHISRAGLSFACVSLCRHFNMRRARIISWFTVQNLCSSDIFYTFFSFCLINSFPNREQILKIKFSNFISQYYLIYISWDHYEEFEIFISYLIFSLISQFQTNIFLPSLKQGIIMWTSHSNSHLYH